ncbi:unnamed protein product [Timema podura]|uniref:Aminopeptidase N n=1 Tax=Timema podura TaxID=61482 RepID=A0ABN7NNQ7_TIMPD|nr:unnamed protein product [Timema podura]
MSEAQVVTRTLPIISSWNNETIDSRSMTTRSVSHDIKKAVPQEVEGRQKTSKEWSRSSSFFMAGFTSRYSHGTALLSQRILFRNVIVAVLFSIANRALVFSRKTFYSQSIATVQHIVDTRLYLKMGVLSTEMELNSGSRTEFISADILENPIEYGRTGGWFFSFTKVVVFVLVALTATVLTGVIVYFSFPCSRVEVDRVVLSMPNSRIEGSSSEPGSDRLNGTTPTGSPDALDSTTSVPVTDLRLPNTLIPLHYKLRVQPFIEESRGDNFTFQGHVTITVNVRAPAGTTLINVHAKNLNIPDKEVSITLLTTPDTKEEVTEYAAATEAIPVVRQVSLGACPPQFGKYERHHRRPSVDVINSDANLTTEAVAVADVTQAPNSVASSSSTENIIVTTTKKSKPNKKGKKTKREINSETLSSKNTRNRRSKEESSSGYIPGPPRIVYAVRDLIKDMYIIHVEPPLLYGNNYTIEIPFSGVLSDTLSGFYRISYTDTSHGQNRWIAATHFRTTHAREAFPCMDEPVMKASFEISVGRRVNMTSISNMPVKRTEKMEKHPEWMWDHFYKTPAMPTYLVSYAVADSNFKVATKNSSGQPTKVTLTKPQDTVTQVSVVASSEAVPLADYVLAITPKILRFFGEYLGVPYPLPKLDMFAIPDFSHAAVQDWGLITFRESELLFNVSTTLMKQELAVVLSHQIALQWFGDLVTAKGWNDLWVNEGFATYMDHTAVNYAEPSWELSDQFLLDHLLPALAADSLGTSHAISVGEKGPDASDKVSYEKDIVQILLIYPHGAEVDPVPDPLLHRKILPVPGIEPGTSGSAARISYHETMEAVIVDIKTDIHYLRINMTLSFSNADTDDLWSSLTNQSRLSKDADILLPPNVTLKEVMSGWTMQPGYPVLTVTRDYGKGSVTLNQLIIGPLHDQSDCQYASVSTTRPYTVSLSIIILISLSSYRHRATTWIVRKRRGQSLFTTETERNTDECEHTLIIGPLHDQSDCQYATVSTTRPYTVSLRIIILISLSSYRHRATTWMIRKRRGQFMFGTETERNTDECEHTVSLTVSITSRFTLEELTEASSSLWYIPVSYMSQAENKITTKPRVWLNLDSEITLHSVTKPGPKEWVLFNLGMTGFYRVNYDERNWELLTNHLMNTKEDQSLPLATKAQLLDDALNLARAGHLEYPVALNLTRYLALKERNYVPWVTAMENLGHLRLLLRDSRSYMSFQMNKPNFDAVKLRMHETALAYVFWFDRNLVAKIPKYLQELMSPIYNELSTSGKAGENRRQSLLRIKILTWMSDSEAPEVLSWAQKLYTAWMDSSSPHADNPIPVDQQRTVYCTAIRHGGIRE